MFEFGRYKESGFGRETHKIMMLDHHQKTKNIVVSYSNKALGFFETGRTAPAKSDAAIIKIKPSRGGGPSSCIPPSS
jgi:hypothetical protein